MGQTLQDLTIKDNFLFAAAMLDGDNCKDLLEMVLEMEIDHLEVLDEKSIVYNPDFHRVRLDVYSKDEHGTCYNVEMQVERDFTELRSRYYHSQMDMDLLLKGHDYSELNENYVIFICDYDPLGLKKYKYTINNKCEEELNYEYVDGTHTIFLSTKGQNEDEVPKSLVNFLKFVSASLEESKNDFEDKFVTKLQRSIEFIKNSREEGVRYMGYDWKFKKMKEEGQEEGREEERELLTKLMKSLFDNNEFDKAKRAVEDQEYCNQLIKEMNIY